ncbi:MAG: Trm112 family protein [FCB group bacterium]|nr:Trm112 family protein [FCB group bacterium]
MIKPEFLKLLACPECKGKLIPDSEVPRLICDQCRLAYPVENDIPRLVKEAAEQLK